MLTSSLLRNGPQEHSPSMSSFDASDQNRISDSAHLLETSKLKQKMFVSAYLYYGLIAGLLITTLLVIIIAIAWAAAKPTVEIVYVPVSMPVSSSSSTGSPSPPALSSSTVKPPVPISISSSSSPLSPAVPDVPNVLLPRFPTYPSDTWPGQIKPYHLLHHLSGLYSIAMDNGGSRVVTGPGFNSTIEYLLATIAQRTNLVNVERTYFTYTNLRTTISPYFSATIHGLNESVNFTFITDFDVARNSQPSDGVPATLILVPVQATGVCTQEDFNSAVGSDPPKHFWLIVPFSNSCHPRISVGHSQSVNASGLIIAGVDRNGAIVSYVLPNTTDIPVIVMSNSSASRLITVLAHGGRPAVTISCGFDIRAVSSPVSNICGDTPMGDPTSVVVVGGHSDGVAQGPGINDNGSGAISTLVLAIALTKLMSDPTINYKPANMVKFCWFGGEEEHWLGSSEVVRVGIQKNTDPNARVGSRAKDWAVMVNLDMLGSLNFQNWVYDANSSSSSDVPHKEVWKGTKALSDLFFEYFDSNQLPSDRLTTGYSSDNMPFLTAGIPAGGVTSGAGAPPFLKTEAQRERYQRMTGWGGVAGAFDDPCQHGPCDSIENIHWGVYTNQTQSVAYVLEKLALRTDLRQWLGSPLTD